MKICHVCNAICEDEIELCPVCGAELVGEPQDSEEAAFESQKVVLESPVLAVSVEDVVTAEIYRDILRENRIPFTCDSLESDGSMKVLFGGSFVAEDIYVQEADLERAQQLYDEVLNAEPQFEDLDFFEETEESEDQDFKEDSFTEEDF